MANSSNKLMNDFIRNAAGIETQEQSSDGNDNVQSSAGNANAGNRGESISGCSEPQQVNEYVRTPAYSRESELIL